MSFLLAALGLFLAYLFLPGPGAFGRRRATPLLLLVVYLLPVLVLGWVFWSAPEEAHRLRLALLGVGFRGEPEGTLAVEIGGDRDDHPVWISAFAGRGDDDVPALGKVVLEGAGEAGPQEATVQEATVQEATVQEMTLQATAVQEAAADGNGVHPASPPPFRVEAAIPAPGLLAIPADRRMRPVQGVVLEDGDRLHLAAGGGGERVYRVERGWFFGAPFRFVPEAAGAAGAASEAAPTPAATGPVTWEIPPRRGDLPILGDLVPIGRPLGGTVATWSLEPLRGGGPEAAGGDPARRGFLYAEPVGLTGARLVLVPPAAALGGGDGTLRVERDGAAVPLARVRGLEPADRIHAVSGPRSRLASQGAAEDGGDGVRPLPRLGGLTDRRSFRVFPGRRSVAFVYDTPEVITLSPRQLADLRFGGTADVPGGTGDGTGGPERVDLSFGEWQVADRSLHLRHVSDRVAAEAAAVLELAAEGGGSFPAATPRGVTEGRLGQPFWLGGEHRAAVQLDRLAPSPWLVALALLLALGKAMAGRAALLTAPAAVVAGGLELVLVFRLVLGYRTWASPPHEPEAWTLALLAWFFLPWAFLAVSVPAATASAGSTGALRRRLFAAGPALAGLLASLSWCLSLAQGALALVLAVAHLGVAAVPAVRWLGKTGSRRRSSRRREGRWRRRLADGWAAVRRRAGRAGQRIADTARGAGRWLGDHPGTAWSLAAFLFTLGRAALLVVGFREAVSWGGPRLALSLLHVPAAVLFQGAWLAWLWRRADRERRISAADLGPAAAILAFVWGVPAVLVSDLGLALLNVPVFLLALLAVLHGARRAGAEVLPVRLRGRRSAGTAVAAGLLLLYLVTVATPLLARTFIAVLPDESLARLESERNFLRLLGYAYPAELQEVGRRQSEEMAVMSEVMDRYTSGPFTGRGWFGSELSPHLAPTALREHALSMWVAAEWGVAGSLALLLAYGLVGLAGRHEAPWREPDVRGPDGGSAFWGTTAALAGLTLAVPSLYMILANYRLTLFTGKNAYLLGLDSAADLLEGLALVVLLGLGLAAARDLRGELEGDLP